MPRLLIVGNRAHFQAQSAPRITVMVAPSSTDLAAWKRSRAVRRAKRIRAARYSKRYYFYLIIFSSFCLSAPIRAQILTSFRIATAGVAFTALTAIATWFALDESFGAVSLVDVSPSPGCAPLAGQDLLASRKSVVCLHYLRTLEALCLPFLNPGVFRMPRFWDPARLLHGCIR